MEIKLLNSLDNPDIKKGLQSLIEKCDGYEPYYSDTSDPLFIQAAAFEENDMVGFIGVLLDNAANIAEVSALVEPSKRRKGIFKNMLLSVLKNQNLSNMDIVCPIPEYMQQSSVVKGLYGTEYLLSLEKEVFAQIPSILVAPTPEELEYEFMFSDDEKMFLLYLTPDDDEPCAILYLDYQNTFTNIYGVYVEEGLRGRGIGMYFLKHFLQMYFTEHPHPLVLNVSDRNKAAYSLYKKCGFTEVSHICYYYINSL